MQIGYVFSLLASLFWSLYLVPRKISKAKPATYTLYIGLGFFTLSLLTFIVQGRSENLFSPILLLSIVGGLMWCTGSVLFTTAIDKAGLFRSNQWKNLQGPIGSLTSLIFLSEFVKVNIGYVIFGTLTIFISALLFTIKKDASADEKNNIHILYALGAAVLWGTLSALQKYITNAGGGVYSQQLCFSFSIFIFGIGFALMQEKKFKNIINIKENYHGAIAGAIYFFAGLFQLLAYKQGLANAIVFAIIQFNAVWTVLIGVLYFKETNYKKYSIRITSGLLLAIASVLLLMKA